MNTCDEDITGSIQAIKAVVCVMIVERSIEQVPNGLVNDARFGLFGLAELGLPILVAGIAGLESVDVGLSAVLASNEVAQAEVQDLGLAEQRLSLHRKRELVDVFQQLICVKESCQLGSSVSAFE